jgi:HEAT repeat protein
LPLRIAERERRLSCALQQLQKAASVDALEEIGQLVHDSKRCRSTFAANAEAVQAVVAVLQRQEASTPEDLASALWLLRGACIDHKPDARAALLQAGACECAVALIAHEDSRVIAEAGLLLYQLCLGDKPSRTKALDAGAMPLVLQQLDHHDYFVKHGAVKALVALMSGEKARSQEEFASASGAMRKLIELLSADNAALAKDTACAIACLASGPHVANQSAFTEAQGMQRLVNALADPSTPLDAVCVLLWAIREMCTGHAENQLQLARTTQGLQTITRWLRYADEYNVQKDAAMAVAQACSQRSIANQNKFAEQDGAMADLISLLRSAIWLVRNSALLALRNVCEGHPFNLSNFAETDGAVADLVCLISDPSQFVARTAIGVVADFLAHPLVKRLFVETDNGLPQLVEKLGDRAWEVKADTCRAITNLCTGGVSRDDERLRFHVGAQQGLMDSLVPRMLDTEHVGVRRQAVAAVGALCSNRHRANQQRFFSQSGAITYLVACICSADQELQRNATWALGVVCDGAPAGNIRGVFEIAPHVVSVLSERLEPPTLLEAQMHACWVIFVLCRQGGPGIQAQFHEVEDFAARISRLLASAEWQLLRNALAAIAALVENAHASNQSLFGACDELVQRVVNLLAHEKPILRAHAAWVIACLAEGGHSANQRKIGACSDGAVMSRLVDMLRDDVPLLRQRAASAIGQLCMGHDDNVQCFLAVERGLDALLDGLRDESTDVRRAAAFTLGVLCRRQHPAAQERLAACPSAMPRVVACLADSDAQVRQNAAWLVGCACDQHAGNQRQVGETQQGFQHLTALLDAEERQIRRNALWSLYHACDGNPSNCAKFLSCDGAWSKLQALLVDGGNDDDSDDADKEIRTLADALSTMLNPSQENSDNEEEG